MGWRVLVFRMLGISAVGFRNFGWVQGLCKNDVHDRDSFGSS